jgi:hypothetical protein
VNSAPLAPGAPSPLSGATVQFTIGNGLTAALGWDCSDLNPGDTLIYNVYLSQNQGAVDNSDTACRIAAEVTTKTVATPALGYGQTYYWKVVARDGHGSSTVGSVWSFTTMLIPAPVLIGCTPNPTKNTMPTLTWNGVTGIGKYHLQTADNTAFSPLLADYADIAGTSKAIDQPLFDGLTYWRVAAVDALGNQGPFSPASDFMVDTVPPVVSASPAGGIQEAAQTVTLFAGESATIFYTLDGSTPTAAARVYSSPIVIDATTTLKFFAQDIAGNLSGVMTEDYTIEPSTPVPAVGQWGLLAASVTLAAVIRRRRRFGARLTVES